MIFFTSYKFGKSCTVHFFVIFVCTWVLNCCQSQVIADFLSDEEVAGIKEGFKVMDINNKGKINIDELRVGLHKLGQQIADADLQILMDAVSIFFFSYKYV